MLEIAVRALDIGSDARGAETTEASEVAIPGSEPGATRIGLQIHPFRAWRRPPGRLHAVDARPGDVFRDRRQSDWARANANVNPLGYQSHLDDYTSLPADAYVVGIFGGSVAANLANFVGDVIARELEVRFPDLAGRVVILSFADGGYKQPQQLIALVEAIELGIPLDLVLNVDGFNEARWGGLDAQNGHHPLLASRIHYGQILSASGFAPTQRELVLAGRAIEAREAAREFERLRDQSPARRSELARLVLGSFARSSSRRAIDFELEMQNEAASSSARASQAAELPIACPADDPMCTRLIVDLWRRGSKQMRVLSHSIGADYVHVLQPNQYLPGSKPLSESELEIMSAPVNPRREVEAIYPQLIAAGADLARDGIEFHDLTRVFADHSETLYRDSCCHYDIAGNEILARAIVTSLRISPGVASSASGSDER